MENKDNLRVVDCGGRAGGQGKKPPRRNPEAVLYQNELDGIGIIGEALDLWQRGTSVEQAWRGGYGRTTYLPVA